MEGGEIGYTPEEEKREPNKQALLTIVAPSPIRLLVFADQKDHPETRGYSQIYRDIADRAGIDPEDFPYSVQDFSEKVKTLADHGLIHVSKNVLNPRRNERVLKAKEKVILPVGVDFPPQYRQIYAGYAGHVLEWADRHGASQLQIMLGSSNTSGGYENSAPSRRRAIYTHLLQKEDESVMGLTVATGTNKLRIGSHVNMLSEQGILAADDTSSEHFYDLSASIHPNMNLFVETVPTKAGLRTLYQDIALLTEQLRGTPLSASSVRRLLTEQNQLYAQQNQQSLNNRISMVLRWMGKYQGDSLIPRSPAPTSVHTNVSINPDIKSSVTELISALNNAEDSSKISEGMEKAKELLSHPERVKAIITDLVDHSVRMSKEPEDNGN